MKPLHIGLLVAAGAIGGALMIKVVETPSTPPPAVTAQAPAASTVATPAQAPQEAPPAAAAPAPEPAKPEPFPEKKQSAVSHRPATKAKKSEPVVVAQNQPPAVNPNTPATPAAQPQPEPAAPPAVKSEPEPVAPPPPPPPPPPQKVTLKAGTLLSVRVVDGLSSERSMPGDQFTGTLDQPLAVDGMVIAERGAKLEGRVVASDKGGKVKGVSSLSIELTRLSTSDGQRVAISTDPFEKLGESSKKQDAAKVGAGAALGAVIGAIAGGGKGAAIGAGVGGAAGAGDVLLTRGKPATIPSETRINFRLREPVTITERQH